MKIKVVYISSTLKRTGPINEVFNIIESLDLNIFEPIVLTLSPEPSDTMKQKFLDLKIKYYSLDLNRLQTFLYGGRKLKSVINKIKPQIIHSRGVRSDVLAYKYLTKYKRFLTVNNFPFIDYPMKFGKIKGKIMARRHIEAIRKCDNAIACSKSIADMFYQKLGIKLKSIQNGINIHEFQPTTTQRKTDLRYRCSIPKDKIVFISVGSLIPRKDMETVIMGFINMNIEKSAILLIAGDGYEKQKLEQITNNDDVLFLGNVTNILDFLHLSDFFISASHSEGLPNAVQEAMATGLPCILSDIEPHKEILESDPSSGKLFKVKNVYELSEKLQSIMKEDYNMLTVKSRSLIENYFNSKKMSLSYQDLYVKSVTF